MKLAAAQKRELLTKGFTRLPGAAKKGRVEAALRDINHMIGQERNPAKAAASDGPSNYNDDYWTTMMSTPAVMSLLYETPAWPAAESLLGEGKVLPDTRAQIALRFPTSGTIDCAPNFHVDNLYYAGSGPRRAPGKIESFTLLVYVLLNDLPQEYSGNFTVCPGSHLLVADGVRRGGLDAIQSGSTKIAPGAPAQITGKAGDVVLCHYALMHDRVENRSPHIRYAAFFRLKHVDHEARQLEALKDPWLEWPGLRSR